MHKPLLLVVVLLSFMMGCAREPQSAVVLPPTADFAASPEQGVAPLEVTFTDLSAGDITRWHWNFGDGQFSDASETGHMYTSAGNYTVSLAVMGPGGSDVETKVEYVRVDSGIISWEEAASYIGQHKVVEGTIVGTYYAADTKSQPTFLDFHKPYQDYFKCIIWGGDRERFVMAFPPNPESYLLNKHVQVTGLLEEYPEGSGVPEMILRDPSQIEVVGE